ncbi:RNA-directed DNA polymerase, eukaryota, reverse transcriptase zinc-binding domain protein [Tanacetum coccineum]
MILSIGSFLRQTLVLFGFPKDISTTAFSINVNGDRHGYFGGRGLRQGDPIYPYLFTLVLEMFYIIVQSKIKASFKFKYHWGCKQMEISHLCFADDLLVFFHGDTESVKVIKGALDEFSKVSGLIPNMGKSIIFFGNVKDHVKQEILSIMPFKVGSLPVTCLHVTKQIGLNECKCLVEKVRAKVNCWKNKMLTYAGRLKLISSVLSSFHVYWASVFIQPKMIVKEIDKLLKGFLLCQGGISKGKAKVVWKSICLPKQQGGISLGKVDECYKVEREKHLGCESGSYGWKQILGLKDKIRPHIVKALGNGKKTFFWHDKWCEIGPLSTVFGSDLMSLSEVDFNAKVSDMLETNGWKWPDN